MYSLKNSGIGIVRTAFSVLGFEMTTFVLFSEFGSRSAMRSTVRDIFIVKSV
jgi:hypothetical protein